MKDSALGFGVFLIATAIVGGGLEAFGFKVGALSSLRRQIILAVFGALIVLASQWNDLVKPLFVYTMKTPNAPFVLDAGQTHTFDTTLNNVGDVTLQVNEIALYQPSSSAPPQVPPISVRICPSIPGDCPDKQVASGGSAEKTNLPAGDVTILVFSYVGNPPVTIRSTTVVKQNRL